MTVLLVLLGATTAALVVAMVRRRPLSAAWPSALRVGLAVMFSVTGVSHFVGLRDDLVAMVPPALPAPELLVTVTGVLELAGAAGLVLPSTAAWAAGGLALLMVAMFPANVHAATSGVMLAGEPATALGPRAAMQVLYIAVAVAVVLAYRGRALRPSAIRDLTLEPPQATGPASAGPVGAVVVTRLELRSFRHVPGLLVASLRLRRAGRDATGAVTLDLAAQPLARTFWTWSAWTDQAAVRAYVRSDRHLRVMRRYGARLRASDARIVAAESAPHTWAEARRLVLENELVEA